jgi:hypothetical protein
MNRHTCHRIRGNYIVLCIFVHNYQESTKITKQLVALLSIIYVCYINNEFKSWIPHFVDSMFNSKRKRVIVLLVKLGHRQTRSQTPTKYYLVRIKFALWGRRGGRLLPFSGLFHKHRLQQFIELGHGCFSTVIRDFLLGSLVTSEGAASKQNLYQKMRPRFR